MDERIFLRCSVRGVCTGCLCGVSERLNLRRCRQSASKRTNMLGSDALPIEQYRFSS
jgi:hypothetical protein